MKATEVYRKFRALSPADPRGSYLVGLGLRAEGKTVEAKRELEASLAMSPDYADSLLQLASISIEEGNQDAALQRVQQQIALQPNVAQLHSILGAVYLARRELGSAEAAFLKAVEFDPGLAGPYVQLGRIYATSGKYEEALAKLDDAIRVRPDNAGLRTLVGMVYQQYGDVEKAQVAYEAVLELDSRLAPAANNLAYIYSEEGGDQEKALELAQTAREVAPQEPNIADTLGWILYKRGVYQRALGLLTESAGKLPENAVVHYHLGMVHSQLGHIEEARDALTKALELDPGFAGADEARMALAGLN